MPSPRRRCRLLGRWLPESGVQESAGAHQDSEGGFNDVSLNNPVDSVGGASGANTRTAPTRSIQPTIQASQSDDRHRRPEGSAITHQHPPPTHTEDSAPAAMTARRLRGLPTPAPAPLAAARAFSMWSPSGIAVAAPSEMRSTAAITSSGVPSWVRTRTIADVSSTHLRRATPKSSKSARSVLVYRQMQSQGHWERQKREKGGGCSRKN